MSLVSSPTTPQTQEVQAILRAKDDTYSADYRAVNRLLQPVAQGGGGMTVQQAADFLWSHHTVGESTEESSAEDLALVYGKYPIHKISVP